jgi:hypothetical protein
MYTMRTAHYSAQCKEGKYEQRQIKVKEKSGIDSGREL